MAFSDLADEVAAVFGEYGRGQVGFDEIHQAGQFRVYSDVREAVRGDHKVTLPITKQERLLFEQLGRRPRNPYGAGLCSGCGGARNRTGQRYCRACHAARMKRYRAERP